MKKTVFCLILSVMLVMTLIPQVTFAVEDESSPELTTDANVITGFAELETTDYYYEGNPDEDELTLNLPETLKVYLGGSTLATDIPVEWEAVEDFDNTDFYFYSMKPLWGSQYVLDSSLSDVLDVPWITVYKQEPENNEVEPIKTEEEAEPALVESAYAASTAENTAAIYNYLTGTMKLNRAAACGVMTNINAESGMSPSNLQNCYNTSFGLTDQEYTSRVNAGKGSYKTKSGTSKNFATDSAGYGLCQWTSKSRKQGLLTNAINSSRSIDNIYLQLEYLSYELQNRPWVYNVLKNVPDTAAGAYMAAADFCLVYEAPANTVNTAASRGKTCLSGYWKTYGGSDAAAGSSFVSLCGYAYPTSVAVGKGMEVSGYVVSNYNIKSITASIKNSAGTTLYSSTKKPGVTAYKLSTMDSALKFSSLSAGTYTYVITATDSAGETVTASHAFKAVSGGSTQKSFGFAINGGTAYANAVAGTLYSGGFPTLPKRGYFKKGDKGKRVKKLQKFLVWAGYSVTTGGTYGKKTVKAVKAFQKNNGLKKDGKFGKKCLARAKAIRK